MEPFLEHHFVADKNQFAWLIFLFYFILLIDATIIQGRKVIKGGNY